MLTSMVSSLSFPSKHPLIGVVRDSPCSHESRDMHMFTNETLSGFDGVMFVSNSEEGVRRPFTCE